MLNIDFLEYIVEFAKTGNLTKASNALHISQSALTRAMQKIESYVGVPLFERGKNKLTLSQTGMEFVKCAEQVLISERAMLDATREFYISISQVSIGLPSLGPIIKYGGAMYSAFSGKSIKSRLVAVDDLMNGLNDGSFDMVFLPYSVPSNDVECKYVYSEKLYVIVPKKHFVAGMTEGVSFDEIDRQSFLISGDLGIWDSVVRRELPRSVFYTQSVDELENQINASTIPYFATDVTLNLRETAERLYIPVTDESAKMDIFIVYKKNNREKIRGFLEIISPKN